MLRSAARARRPRDSRRDAGATVESGELKAFLTTDDRRPTTDD
jgi:hypothetical protein